jgi:SAM-dependent methyltransferase
MYGEAALFYDLIHDARGRDADAEADLVLGELRQRNPGIRSLLDVACGTGANLPRFAEKLDVAGLDASADMLALAQRRSPGSTLVQADMRTFSLERRFDAVVCLFSGIGYLLTIDDLHQAVAAMANHLNQDGVLMIEGWVEPDYWLGSRVHSESANSADVAVARVVRSHRDGELCELSMRYTAAYTDRIVTIDEAHTMRLSHPDEFRNAYEAAGLTFDRLPHMLRPGRACYLGVKE